MNRLGRHCLIDAWSLAPDGSVDPRAEALLNDPAYLAGVLDELVGRVGMQILKPAEMLSVPLDASLAATDADCGGVTGVVILTTSHGSVHTWPLRGQVSFDLYSCRDFDADAVLAFLRRKLHLSGGTFRSVPRGHDPRHRFEFVDLSPPVAATDAPAPFTRTAPSPS